MMSAEKQIPILTCSPWQACNVQDRAIKMGFRIPTPLHVDSPFYIDSPLREKRVLIDDAEFVIPILLKKAFGLEAEALAITKPIQITKAEIAEKFDTTVSEMEIID